LPPGKRICAITAILPVALPAAHSLQAGRQRLFMCGAIVMKS
jgi:hypothetical protein